MSPDFAGDFTPVQKILTMAVLMTRGAISKTDSYIQMEDYYGLQYREQSM